MTVLALLADDLTGALDASVPFAARGLRTMAALAPEAIPACLERDPAILAISVDSRALAPDAAREATATCLEKLPAGIALFKKIDSRLKGNIAAELDAFDYARALVVPAIPAFGRWTRNGRLGGFGVDVEIDIAGRLESHAARSAIPDVTTMQDIESAIAGGDFDLPVGARGLAEAMAIRLTAKVQPATHPVAASAMTFVIGSNDPITLEQIAVLKGAHPSLVHIRVTDHAELPDLPARAAITLIEATGAGGALQATSCALAQVVARRPPRPDEILVISGGATAQAVLGHMGIDTLELEGEALPGLPVASVGNFKVVTKSGGFGGRDTLARLLDFCRRT